MPPKERVNTASATVVLTAETLVTGIQNRKRLKFLERLAIHISKSKAWMVKGADGCAICKQIHTTMGLGLGGIKESGAAMLAQGNDNGMAESPGNIK